MQITSVDLRQAAHILDADQLRRIGTMIHEVVGDLNRPIGNP